MSQREQMQRLVELKRALEKDMGISVDMSRYGVEQRLLRLARASDAPEVRALAAALENAATETQSGATTGASSRAGSKTENHNPERRIRGYYRGRPVYDE
ncbi:MAG: hypothetical protein ABR561_01660 [Guyparkeria sp.]